MTEWQRDPDELIEYKRVGDVSLKLHLYRPVAGGAPRPAIVFFFGGGWNGGSPSQFYAHCSYFASRGIIAIAAEYRTKTQHGTEPRSCVVDGRSAIRWVREHAGELGVDPNRILAGGGSAGAHVAAVTGSVDGFDEPDEDLSVSARPAALVLFNPVYDTGPTGFGHERVIDYWEAFSPMHNISSATPPTISFFGTEDKICSSGSAEEYRRRMRDAGVRSELFFYEGQPHGFFNYRDGSNPYFAATVHEADRFLASLGYLDGPPAIEKPAL